MRTICPVLAVLCVCWPAGAQGRDQKLARAIVVDIVNTTRDRHAALLPAATDALAVALTRAGAYDVVSRREVDRAAADRRLKPPYDVNDLSVLAKDIGAVAIVAGELRFIEVRGREPSREINVGLFVRVKDVATGEMVNGAAERGTAPEAADGSKTDYAVLLDAAVVAADRCADRIAEYRPIVGTILNHESTELVVLNKGQGDGVKKGQEFVAYRGSTSVARLKVFKLLGTYTLLKVTEATLGVRPQDRAVAVFPEPKFAK